MACKRSFTAERAPAAKAFADEFISTTTPFIGRETELVELAQLLARPEVRLVTIVGPGGMGKSRLAIEAANSLPAAVKAFENTMSAADPFAAGFDFWGGELRDVPERQRSLRAVSKWRPLIVPKPGPSQATDDATAPCAPSPCSATPPSLGGSRYRPWAELLRKTFAVDVETCPRCGGRMRLMALITEPQSVARFLRHRGEPTEPPARAPPRDPPFFKTLVVRRQQPSEPSTQRELFEEH